MIQRAEFNPNPNELETIILTASAGGLISAARTLQAQYPQNKCAVVNIIEDGWLQFDWILERDRLHILHHVPGVKRLFQHNYGKEKVELWNKAQKQGDLKTLNKLISLQHVSSLSFGKKHFDRMSVLLNNHPKLNQIISTQPVGLHEIHKAIAKFNRKHNKSIEFTVVFTDLPTESATHFLNPIKSITHHDLKYCKLNLKIPFAGLSNSLNAEECHKAFAKLCPELYENNSSYPKSNIQIEFNLGPIDPLFIETYKHIKECSASFIKEQFKHQLLPLQFTEEALSQLEKYELSITSQFSNTRNNNQKKYIKIPTNAQIKTIMLGSQPSVQGTLDVIDFEHALDRKVKNKGLDTYIFVFCGDDMSEKSLFSEVCKKARYYENEDNYKYKNLGKFIVIPLTRQEKPTINHLYTIADRIIIHSGGLSVMEVFAVATGVIIIYAELSDAFSPKELYERPELALVKWEKGNASRCKAYFGENKVFILNSKNYFDIFSRLILNEHSSLFNGARSEFLTFKSIAKPSNEDIFDDHHILPHHFYQKHS